MGKLRVHELAKKLNLSNQEVIAKLNTKGVLVRTHSSSVDEKAALMALGLSDESLKEQDQRKTPRTVLRKRRDEPSFNNEQEENNLMPIEILNKEESLISPDEDIFNKEEVFKVQETNFEVALVPDKEEANLNNEIVEKIAEKSPSNVVRVIDADAIKARLASEGRSFGARRAAYTPSSSGDRSGPRTYPSSANNQRYPSSPNASRTYPSSNNSSRENWSSGDNNTNNNNNYQPSSYTPHVDRTPSDSNNTSRAGARPSKKKKVSSYSKEMKEANGSTRENWLNPGKKKKHHQDKSFRTANITTAAAHKRVIEMGEAITVNELAHRMAVKAGQLVSKLISMGMMVTVNEAIDFDTASIIATEFGFEIKNVAFEETSLIKEEQDESIDLVPRAPIVTIMGHVDHGKTSLLDALRKSTVAKGEAGGITQHIGAYTLKTDHGLVTFLDTPGHEAFSSMRARGAQVTDIVVLVVAADDGVMPQTKEAIDHAKAAKAPVIVAINKMDLPDAKPERVMQQLADHGLLSEEWGGDTQFIKVSAAKKTGLTDLIDALITLAEVMELKANPKKLATGCVIEAKLDKGRGPVATVLPQSGTLKQGDYIVAGESLGRVRAMYDSYGNKLQEAGPSIPVQVLGLSSVPVSGDKFNAVVDDKTAKTIADHRAHKIRELELLKIKHVSLESFLAQSVGDEAKVLRLIIKADVYGSAEALSASLLNLSTKEVKVEVIHSGVGTITESNVNLAMASKAIIIGFNIKADGKAAILAQQEKIDIKYYSVIYEAMDEVQKSMAGMLAPVFEEKYLGKAEVRMIISVSKHGKIAGSYVTDGKIVRSAKIRLKRKNIEVFSGNISSLKRFKDDVKEVAAGYECGIVLESNVDLIEGDILECFELKEVRAKLSEALSASEEKRANA
jgi:translation initiation factor IF-2